MTFAEKKAKIIKHVTRTFNKIDPSGYNAKKFTDMVQAMSEPELKKLIQAIKDGKWRLTVEMPNLKTKMEMPKLLQAAEELGVKIFQRLKITDVTTGVTYWTNEAYPILALPVRRTQQTIEKKISLPHDDQMIDALTGQVTGADKAAAISNPEIQALHTRGLDETLKELVQVRGGNPETYGVFRSQLEESGSADIDTSDPTDRTRVAQMAKVLLAGMHIDSNI